MDVDGFWQVVQDAREAVDEPADVDAVASALVDRLAQLSADDIRAADRSYRQLAGAAYGWPLWGAAYVIQGGCSDDGFDYFLGWLIGQGRDIYLRAVADPDSLADVVDAADAGKVESEDLAAATLEAHHRVTGSYDMGGSVAVYPELGPGWDFDDEQEMRNRYPRLTRVFLS